LVNLGTTRVLLPQLVIKTVQTKLSLLLALDLVLKICEPVTVSDFFLLDGQESYEKQSSGKSQNKDHAECDQCTGFCSEL
jgi:hypothetical protein